MIIKDIEKIDISSHLSRIRTDNEKIRNARYDEIYNKIPEIRDIDENITALAVAETKKRIMGSSSDSDDSSSDINIRLKELADRKTQLLIENGYSSDYLEPIYNCDKCKDWGELNGQVCSCVKLIRIKELYKRSNLQDIFERENFSTFSLDYYSREKGTRPKSPHENASHLLAKAKNFVENFDSDHGNILLYGNTGLGKTFLSNCIAKELLDSGHSVLYLSANELFEDILGSYIMTHNRSSALEAVYEYVYSSDLLIIDDLGTELMTNFTRSQLFEIINKRMLSKHSTIITTNLDLETLEDKYTERVMSRIADGYVLYPLYGDDIRYLKHKKPKN